MTLGALRHGERRKGLFVKRRIIALLALLLAGLLVLTGCGQKPVPQGAEVTEALTVVTLAPTSAPEESGPITEPQAIADYLFAHGELPPNFITKAEAEALGWTSGQDLHKYAPGKSIGGEYFGNYEGKLPKAKGRKFTECDANYTGGKRGGERIVYSNDGRVWYTADHYETFTELFPSN